MPINNLIKLEDIGVKYELGGIGDRLSISNVFSSFGRNKKVFWALRHIDLSIKEGEIIYVIGRNGAGKSTLLKILAETLMPDEGSIHFGSKSKAFMSMGLGFFDRLNGYENISIGLRLLGVSKEKIPELIYEIEEFTELNDFLKQPVKSYSTGMRMRLAFAIATSICPDILIMDEIINAGDESFRKKSKKRMLSLFERSRVAIICTHTLKNVRELATKALWLENGSIIGLDDPNKIVDEYKIFIGRTERDKNKYIIS